MRYNRVSIGVNCSTHRLSLFWVYHWPQRSRKPRSTRVGQPENYLCLFSKKYINRIKVSKNKLIWFWKKTSLAAEVTQAEVDTFLKVVQDGLLNEVSESWQGVINHFRNSQADNSDQCLPGRPGFLKPLSGSVVRPFHPFTGVNSNPRVRWSDWNQCEFPSWCISWFILNTFCFWHAQELILWSK